MVGTLMVSSSRPATVRNILKLMRLSSSSLVRSKSKAETLPLTSSLRQMCLCMSCLENSFISLFCEERKREKDKGIKRYSVYLHAIGKETRGRTPAKDESERKWQKKEF